LLGNDAVLLPIPAGKKRPVFKQWESTTAKQMQDPKYLAKLNGQGNIGVLLGHGRATIDIDQDKFVEPFLNLNPKLRATLRSRRKRGCNFWLRIKGNYPSACKLKTQGGADWGEWRADGNQTVIHGAAIDRRKGEKKPTAYKIEHAGPPIELAFDEIRWPDELLLPWQNEALAPHGGPTLDGLRKLYGQPYYFNKEGDPSALNESFWAGLFAAENIILWEPIEREFYTYNPEAGIYEEESADAVKRRLSERCWKLPANQLPLAGNTADRQPPKRSHRASPRDC
jgi:Bifunctional DNA primase/polymerase, N-terminal.